jgi:hypothetical protein
MEHLSPAWIAAFDEVVRAHPGLREATAHRRVVVEFTVAAPADRSNDAGPGDSGPNGAPNDGTVVYALVLDHGENRVIAGAQPDPDITLRTDRSTAVAIASHAESAQTAFIAGRLRLGGDVRVLIANQDVLAEIDDCTRGLREQTQFGPVTDGAVGA